MNAQEIIERIRTAEKKTPVRVFLKAREPGGISPCHRVSLRGDHPGLWGLEGHRPGAGGAQGGHPGTGGGERQPELGHPAAGQADGQRPD